MGSHVVLREQDEVRLPLCCSSRHHGTQTSKRILPWPWEAKQSILLVSTLNLPLRFSKKLQLQQKAPQGGFPILTLAGPAAVSSSQHSAAHGWKSAGGRPSRLACQQSLIQRLPRFPTSWAEIILSAGNPSFSTSSRPEASSAPSSPNAFWVFPPLPPPF